MRNLTSIAIAAAVAASLPAAGTAAAASAPTASTVVVKGFNSCGYAPTTAIRLRTGPSTKYATIGLLHPDDSVSAIKAEKGWYKVSVDFKSKSGLKAGRTGWVAKANLEPNVCMQLD
ncbi:SH3 domain-containing protein [Streptomyces lunaelactis]|uniref:SH3 domain-containing protein n=1 Tax=Streptomyces lunaelactis TaxID=1535768 RepID=UPI0015851A42|nr:SH3 domain-containing protein [Streptomyces lunaelactis]NUK50085.1 SH3 domain-containing protein [Streptomyces lunaelactis]